ncbi:unnamed protein product [Adineta steineri]|uniref:Uncharacterized protein n=1 Tax=Adineta steineri TaxID=433720 RepID=A0A819XUE3_9BILA|nr:unnamed protein product [Adineta steineri]
MASQRSTGKDTSSQNQPPSCETKRSLSNKPLAFPTYDPSGRYTPNFPSRSTPDPTYTSSLDTPNPNPKSPSKEELHGVTPDESVFLVPNNESIGQISAIYQIPRARSSQRRTQPYGENETLATTIDDLIIDTISEIRDPIETIEHQGDTEFPSSLDFPEGDSNYQDFPEAEGSSGPPEPPENNTTCATPTSPRSNLRFRANMAANRPWLAADVVAVPGAQHPLPKHPSKLLPKFDPDNDITPEDHIRQFMLS